MSKNTDHDENANGSNSTGPSYIDTVLDRTAPRTERFNFDSVDENAALVRRLRVAQEFDDAEAREHRQKPEPLEGKPACSASRYRVEGETDEKWLTTNYVIPVGVNSDE